MTTAAAPKLRKYLYRNLVDKAEPGIHNPKTTEYVFSNGRKFERNLSRNRTA